nr:MAG TPA: hemadin [Caudoviricetes sp.]
MASLYRIAVCLYKQSVQKGPCHQDLLYVQLR